MEEGEEHCRDTRIRGILKDSLLSRFTNLDPFHSPSSATERRRSVFFDRRLGELFTSFHTPSHPPYALMIRRAIVELNEGEGSTEEAISEFVRREYEDLPWAHERILGVHLRKLCQVKEIECTKDGRYVILVVDGGGGREEAERSNGRKKRGRGRKRKNSEGGEIERGARVEEAGTEKPSEVLELAQDKEEKAHNHSIGRVEEQTESEDGHGQLEVVGEKNQHLEVVVPAPNQLEESQIEDFIPHLETVYSSPQTALNLPVDSQRPSPIPILEELPKCILEGSKLSLTQVQPQILCPGPSQSSLDAETNMSTPLEHKQDENPIYGDVDLLHPDDQCTPGPGIGLERHPTLQSNEHHINEQLDQVINDPNFPDDLTHDLGEWLEVPISEESQKCMQLQKSSDIDLGSVSKAETSFSWMNSDDDKQPQQFNPGSPQVNLDENPMYGDPNPNPPKRRRGRPRKSETVSNQPRRRRLVLSSDDDDDDDIHNKQKPTIKKTGRGRGRPRKDNQCKELLPVEDRVQLHGQGRGRGRSRGRGRGGGRGRGRGRGQGRGPGRPPKLNPNTIQSEEQVPEPTAS